MLKRLLPALIPVLICCQTAAANTCSDLNNGNWSSPSTWTACNKAVPHDGDTVVISGGHTIKLDQNVGTTAGGGLKSITISANNASSLITDGLTPHTIVMGSTGTACGSTVASIFVQRGSLDFSAATATNYVKIQSANSTYPFSIQHTAYLGAGQTATLKLNYTILSNLGTGSSTCEGIYFPSDAGLQTLSLNHVLITGGAGVVYASTYAMVAGSPSVSNTTWVNRTGPSALILQLQGQKGTAWQISNNTDYAPTAATGSISLTDASPDNLTIDGFVTYWTGAGGVMITDPATSTNAQPAIYKYNVDIQNPSQAGTGIAFQVPSGSVAGTTIQNNVCEYVANCLYPAATTATSTWSGNWMSANLLGTAVQGTIFVPQQNTVFNNNTIVFDSIPTTGVTSVICAFFYYGAITSFYQNTCVFPTGGSTNLAVGIIAGDGGILPVASPSTFTNNLVTLGSLGFADYSANVYGTTGTGGVGVAGNNMYGQTGLGAYYTAGTSTNYVTTAPHPNAIYGDTSYNPVFVDSTRRIGGFDASLGGPGTDLDFAQMMAARCGLTSVTGLAGGLTYNPYYTPQALYQYLTAGFAPKNLMLTGKGSTTPVIFGAW